jgi:inhibitor of growth protein 3
VLLKDIFEAENNVPNFQSTMLVKKTTYPHVLPNLFVPPPHESGQRRRAPNDGGLFLGLGDASPHKRRRVVHDEDLDYYYLEQNTKKR